MEQISRALDTWRRDLRQGKPAGLPLPEKFDLGPQGEHYYNELMRGAGGSDMPADQKWKRKGTVERHVASQARAQGNAGASGAAAATWASSLPDVFGAAKSATRKAERGLGKAFRAFSGKIGSKLF